MMSGPEIYPAPDYGDYGEPVSYTDLISQGISEAARTAQVVGAGYPPQGVYAPVYAPQYPGQQAPQVTPQYYPQQGPGVGVTPTPQGAGIQLSTTTLMLLVGGVLLFVLGSKKGR